MTFSQDVGRFAKQSPQKADQARRKIILDLFSAIIVDTPVDTGRAQGNWQTTAEEPAHGTIERFGEAESIAEIDQNISGPDGVTYMANNLPYIEPLEYGHSGQAPEGMVRKNVARIGAIVKEAGGSIKV